MEPIGYLMIGTLGFLIIIGLIGGYVAKKLDKHAEMMRRTDDFRGYENSKSKQNHP